MIGIMKGVFETGEQLVSGCFPIFPQIQGVEGVWFIRELLPLLRELSSFLLQSVKVNPVVAYFQPLFPFI